LGECSISPSQQGESARLDQVIRIAECRIDSGAKAGYANVGERTLTTGAAWQNVASPEDKAHMYGAARQLVFTWREDVEFMKNQNYGNHARVVPAFHFFLLPLGFITAIAAIVHLFTAAASGESLFTSLLLASLAVMAPMTMLFARTFACKAQDRAIRAELNLRYFILAGELLDPRLTMRQIIALRFASNEELLSLCEKAAEESTAPDAIKRSIRNWQADHDRV
jgi:hypothetical protein